MAARQASKIAELEESIIIEQSRVIRLSRHVAVTEPRMVSIAKSAVKSCLAGSVRHITLAQTLNLTAMNMTKILKTTTMSVGKGNRSEASSSDSSIGNAASDEILAWTNFMSKSAVGMTVKVESGETVLLDDYLPAIQPARSIESLKNGKQIARVVLRMIAQILNVPTAPPPKSVRPPPRPSVPAPSPSDDQAGPSIPTSISMDQLQDLKQNEGNAHGLIYLTIVLMTSYMHCPSFSLEHIVNGKVESIECLVHYLLLAWTYLPGHSLSKEEKIDHTKIQEKQASVLKELETICDSRCGGNTLKIAALTLPELEEVTTSSSTAATDDSRQKENGSSNTGYVQGEHAVARETMRPYDVDTYNSIGSALEKYLSVGGEAEKLDEALSELERGVRDMTDFTNSVYMKQKAATAGVQFTLNAIKQQSMRCIKQLTTTS